MNRPSAAVIANVLLLGAFYTVLNWNTFTGPFERDEGEYAYAAWLLSDGVAPYEHSFLQKPPLIIYTYFFAGLIDPSAVWPPRLFAGLFVLGTAVLLWLTAERLHGRRAAWGAVWIFFPAMVQPALFGFAANTEKFMILPVVGALAIYACRRQTRSAWPWFLFGLIAALAILYKPLALPVLAFVVVVWMSERWLARPDVVEVLRNVAALIAGGVAAAAASLWYFVSAGALGALWESAVVYNRHYAEVATVISPNSTMWFLSALSKGWGALFLLVSLLPVLRPPRWWLPLALVVIAFITAARDFNGHYYIMAAPLLALAGGASLQGLSERIESRLTRRRLGVPETRAARRSKSRTGASKRGTADTPAWSPAFRGGVAPLLIGAVTASVAVATMPQWALSPDELVRRTYRGNPFPESRLVAERVAAMTTPDDKVFVAGSEPQVLFYAKRRSPTRFVIMYPLTFPTPVAEAYQKEVIADLDRDPPKVIVHSRPGASWMSRPSTPSFFGRHLDALLQSDAYRLTGAFVKTPDGGRWEEPVTPEHVKVASLVVYRKE